MLGFEHAGYLVRLILEVISGIKYFMLILVITIVGFSISFILMFNVGSNLKPDEDEVYGRANMILYVFAMMLGDFDTETFAAAASAALTWILFIVFMFLVFIVMLNLLIAIMGDIFDRIQENSREQFLYGRAKIILEFEEQMEKDEAYFPTWLQVLAPTAQLNTREYQSWSGHLRSLRNDIDHLGNNTAEAIATLAKTFENELQKVKKDAAEREEDTIKKVRCCLQSVVDKTKTEMETKFSHHLEMQRKVQRAPKSFQELSYSNQDKLHRMIMAEQNENKNFAAIDEELKREFDDLSKEECGKLWRHFTKNGLGEDDQRIPPNKKKFKKKTLTFYPGPMGITDKNWGIGTIRKMSEGGQADHLDVENGWRIIEVEGKPYTEALLDEYATGNEKYKVTFETKEQLAER